MSAIKDLYGKTKLSDEKKAELKTALGQQFPQYASIADKTEVIGMNNNTIKENSGRIKVRSKLRTGAVIAAAAVVAVIGGMKLARDQYIERSLIQPAGQGEDNYTTDREDSVKEDYSPQEGYIADGDKTIRGNTKTIFNSACEAYADLIDSTGDELVLGEEKMITPEMVRKSRETKIVHENGKCSALEFAAAMDKNIYGSLDEDLTQYDFAVDFMYDESGTKVVGINYVYIYLDPEHKSFTTYPPYGANGGITENGITRRFSYDSSCAKKLYEETEAAIKHYNENGEYFTIDSINMTAASNEYGYLTDDYVRNDIEEDDEMRFSRALLNEDSMTMQLRKDGNNFVIKFTHDSSGNVNGVDRVFVQVFKDGADENGKQKSKRYVYPDENNTARSQDDQLMPNVTGMNLYDALDVLNGYDFDYSYKYVYDPDQPEETVISTTPKAGTDTSDLKHIEIEFTTRYKVADDPRSELETEQKSKTEQ